MKDLRYFKAGVCPHCHKLLKISFSIAGKYFNCPRCNAPLRLISKYERKKRQNEKNTIKLPEKKKNIISRIIRRIYDGIKYVYRICKDKDS